MLRKRVFVDQPRQVIHRPGAIGIHLTALLKCLDGTPINVEDKTKVTVTVVLWQCCKRILSRNEGVVLERPHACVRAAWSVRLCPNSFPTYYIVPYIGLYIGPYIGRLPFCSTVRIYCSKI